MSKVRDISNIDNILWKNSKYYVYNILFNLVEQIIGPVVCTLKEADAIPFCPSETFGILLIL